MSFGDYFIHGASFSDGYYSIDTYLKEDCTTYFSSVQYRVKKTWERFSLISSGIGIASCLTGVTILFLLQSTVPIVATAALVVAISFCLFCLARATTANAIYNQWNKLNPLLEGRNENIVKLNARIKENKEKCATYFSKLQNNLDNNNVDAIITQIYVSPLNAGQPREFPKKLWPIKNALKQFGPIYTTGSCILSKKIDDAKAALETHLKKLNELQAIFVKRINKEAEGRICKDYIIPFRDEILQYVEQQFTEVRNKNTVNFEKYLTSMNEKKDLYKQEVVDLMRQLLAHYRARNENFVLPNLREIKEPLEELPAHVTSSFTFDSIPEEMRNRHTELIKAKYVGGYLPPEDIIPDYINGLPSVVFSDDGSLIHLKKPTS